MTRWIGDLKIKGFTKDSEENFNSRTIIRRFCVMLRSSEGRNVIFSWIISVFSVCPSVTITGRGCRPGGGGRASPPPRPAAARCWSQSWRARSPWRPSRRAPCSGRGWTKTTSPGDRAGRADRGGRARGVGGRRQGRCARRGGSRQRCGAHCCPGVTTFYLVQSCQRNLAMFTSVLGPGLRPSAPG